VPVVAALLCYTALRSDRVIQRNRLPEHLQGHPVFAQRDLISAPMGARLVDLVRRIGASDGYPTNTADTKFYETANEHVGEARPVNADGGCDHPYLIPNRNRTLCALAGRIDIGRHLILTGGARGLREKYEKIISRVQSFGAYHFDLSAYPVAEQLFQEDGFQNAAKRVCPSGKRHLDPFQFNFILQVPGQTVSTHVDGVYFWGASRMQFPQWLLAAMKFSGLWEDVFVDQVQVVGYLHSWSPKEEGQGDGDPETDAGTSIDNDDYGSFVYWNDKSAVPKRVLPYPLSGNVVDGSKVAHAASVYRMHADLPYIDKSKVHWLKAVNGDGGSGGDGGDGDGSWTVSNDDEGVLQNYTFDDLRISIVYRARCFTDQEEADRFRAQLHGKDGEGGRMSMDQVLGRFVTELVRMGKLKEGSTLNSLDRLELSLMILDTFITYPLPSTPLIPWNYCALSRLVPALEGPLSLIC
jgi:hypothetical protein